MKIPKTKPKLDEKHSQFVKDLVKQNAERGEKTVTREIIKALKEKFSIEKLTISTVTRFMSRIGLSYKRAKLAKLTINSKVTVNEDLLKRFIVGQFMIDIFEFF
jgi:transposase